MSDWTIDTDPKTGERKLHISGGDLLVDFEANERVYQHHSEKTDRMQITITLSWNEGKFMQESHEQTFYLSNRNLEVFRQFIIEACDKDKAMSCLHFFVNEQCAKCGEWA